MLANFIIYLIAFFEGFTTLAVEVLVIRKATPIIGNTIVSTSIILGIIILALSLGYYMGGLISSKYTKEKIINRLSYNLVLSGLVYTFISFSFENKLLEFLIDKLDNYIMATFLMAFVLFVLPVYIASQTVPLLSEICKINKKGETVGKILFFSTIGSFLGSLVPVLVFLPFLGLTYSIFIIGLILILCSLVLMGFFRKKVFWLGIFSFFLIIVGWVFSYKNSTKELSFETQYYNLKIGQFGGYNVFHIDGAYSSSFHPVYKISFFPYIRESVNIVQKMKAKNILVIGAAGFSFPYEISKFDFVENIDVVDIDPALKDISEKYFIGEKLSDKIKFSTVGGRYFLNKAQKENKKYDFVLVDAYTSKMNIPEQLLTKEFFESLKNVGTVFCFNMILDWDLNSNLSKNILYTMQNVFGNIYFKNTNIIYGKQPLTNFMVSNDDKVSLGYSQFTGIGEIYLDDKNRMEFDKFAMYYNSKLGAY